MSCLEQSTQQSLIVNTLLIGESQYELQILQIETSLNKAEGSIVLWVYSVYKHIEKAG